MPTRHTWRAAEESLDGGSDCQHDEEQLARLPDVPNVIAMTGYKFGSTGQPSMTWAMNVWLPGLVCRKRTRHLLDLRRGQDGGGACADRSSDVGSCRMQRGR